MPDVLPGIIIIVRCEFLDHNNHIERRGLQSKLECLVALEVFRVQVFCGLKRAYRRLTNDKPACLRGCLESYHLKYEHCKKSLQIKVSKPSTEK